MPACSHDNQYSSLPPPGFTQDNLALKRVQLIDLLEKIINKCQHESQFVEEQPKQIDLLFSIAQFTLLPTSTTNNGKRDFLHNVVTIAQDLLTDENQINISSGDSSSPPIEEKEGILTAPPSDTPNNDDDEGGFSLDDLANEYLKNEPSPVSLNDKPITPSESGEADLTLDDLSKNSLSSSTSILSKLLFAPISNESIIKPPLESILFSNRLSSHDAADDADCIWKEESSPLGQMFCKKSIENQTIVTKHISTCLFDRSLYERLTRLIALLPKQCIQNSVQQLSIRPNAQTQRPQRQNNDSRRPQHRPTFHENASQAYPMQRYPQPPNSHQYINPNYGNQQGNFIDQRQQIRHPNFPPQPFAQNTGGHPYQQRGPPKNNTYAGDHQYHQRGPPRNNAYDGDHQYQQRGPPRNNAYEGDNQYQQKGPPKNNPYGGGNQQQKKKQAAPPSQNNQNQRGSKKGGGGGGKYFTFVLNLFKKNQ